jgi:nucleoside-diphosphate-sugar epimerase
MKKAIITGSTGLVGLSVVRKLTAAGIDVLCLGRQNIGRKDMNTYFGNNALYIQLEMENIMSLGEKLEKFNWSPGDECVFFNFAWGGAKGLTDGGFDIQLSNATFAANAVRAAKLVGCLKFVNAGTLEETFAEQYLLGGAPYDYQSSQTYYALAKLSARDMCQMVAYLEKIDYIHTRMSIPLSFDLSRGSYVAQTLKKIAKREHYTLPENQRLFDIISSEDVACAYQLIGKLGQNKADYFIGSSRPAMLKDYFSCFDRQVNGLVNDRLRDPEPFETKLFSTARLRQDTGFATAMQFEDLFARSGTL